MIAALPMYDFPWVEGANDAFWRGLRDCLREQGIAAPERLTRGVDLANLWRDPALLFGQTCGYPYWFGLRDAVKIVATPLYACEGCEGPNHCSFLVVRQDDSRETLAEFRGARAAINSDDSNSGMNLFRAAVAPLAQRRPFFADVVRTAAHAASLAAVADGRADIAAIDCVSFALIKAEPRRNVSLGVMAGLVPAIHAETSPAISNRITSDSASGPHASAHSPSVDGRDKPGHDAERNAGDAQGPSVVTRLRILARTPSSPSLPFICSRALPKKTLAALRAALADAAAPPALGLRGVAFPPASDYARVADLERQAVALGYPRLA